MQNQPKSMHSYPPTVRRGPRQLTPPSSSKMYWHHSFDIHASPQSGSPLAPQPAVSESHFDTAYITHNAESRSIHDDEIPPPPEEQFFGSFSVSAIPEPEQVGMDYHTHLAPSYYPEFRPMEAGSAALAMNQHQPLMPLHLQQHLYRPLAPPPVAPTLAQPDPREYRQHGRKTSAEVAKVPQSGSGASHPYSNGSPRGRTKKPTQGVKKRPQKKTSGSNPAFALTPERDDNEPLPINFKEDCPERERWLVEAVVKTREHKGTGMWDIIQAEFEKKFGDKFADSALQMKHSRAKSKWIIWSEEDVSLQRGQPLCY
jgi:hypothetical protein